MSKTIFIIPGFKEQISDTNYRWLVSYLKDNDYVVHPVLITWNNRTVTQNAQEFLDFFELHKTENSYVLGFSYGAVIALMTAKIVNPEKLILCSLSADFKEDTNSMPVWLRKYIGVNRYEDTKNRSSVKLAKSLETDTIIFCGEKESVDYPQLLKRCEETAELAKKSILIMVKEAPHDISFPTYQAAIKKVI